MLVGFITGGHVTGSYRMKIKTIWEKITTKYELLELIKKAIKKKSLKYSWNSNFAGNVQEKTLLISFVLLITKGSKTVAVVLLYTLWCVLQGWGHPGMWRKILALVTGVIVGYWLIDDFNPGKKGREDNS